PTRCLSLRPPVADDISSLSLHDALPISPHEDSLGVPPPRLTPRRGRPPLGSRLRRSARRGRAPGRSPRRAARSASSCRAPHAHPDRKSTRLNSSHVKTSYAVFCLKKKPY